MRKCILCQKPVLRHIPFTAQNSVYNGKTEWEFAHTRCLEQRVISSQRVVYDYIVAIGEKFKHKFLPRK